MFHTRPKTTQERRHSCAKGGYVEIEGYRIKIRACRNSNNLPNAWDDYMRSDIDHHTWKRHRKTQYKLL